MYKLSIKILVVLGLLIAGLFVWRQLSGDMKPGVTTQRSPADMKPDEIRSVITGVITRVFSRENLLVVKLDTDDQQAWNQLVTGLREYVEKNYKDELNDFTKIVDASKQLLTTQNNLYQYTSKAFVVETDQRRGRVAISAKEKEKGLSAFDVSKIIVKQLSIDEIFEKLQPLASYQKELEQLQVSLNAKAQEIKKSWTIKKEKREVCEILSFFAMSVEEVINKLFNDTRAILAQRLTEVNGDLFGQGNLLLIKITHPQERAWENLMRDFRVFIASRDQSFSDDLTIINNAGLQVIKTLQSLYKAMEKTFPLSTEKVSKIEELNLNNVRASDITSQLREGLQVSKTQITALQKQLESKVQGFTNETPKATKFAGELMLQLATNVRGAIQKAIEDTAAIFPKFAFAVHSF